MRILLTGATGRVGVELVQRLLRDGHRVTAWVRCLEKARVKLGPDVELVEACEGDIQLQAAVETADAVVNLAGENIFEGRWTRARKRALVDSRVALTQRVARAIRRAEEPPGVLVSASAIGFYGTRSSGPVAENQGPGRGFLARLCKSWEHAARIAAQRETRVALLRIGVVFGRDGTALQKMASPIRAGIGGRLGSGRQRVSWIHIDDLVEIIVYALEKPHLRGPINATAPQAVTNAELTQAIAQRLGRWAPLAVPEIALRLALGEAASMLLEGASVTPARLLQLEFPFRFPTLERALADLLVRPDEQSSTAAITPREPAPESGRA